MCTFAHVKANKANIISTIVDQYFPLRTHSANKANIISTIVDCVEMDNQYCSANKANIISTIVDVHDGVVDAAGQQGKYNFYYCR